jgi:hypothetical protein
MRQRRAAQPRRALTPETCDNQRPQGESLLAVQVMFVAPAAPGFIRSGILLLGHALAGTSR